MCMNNEFLSMPWNWAGEQAISEAEAFETALKRSKETQSDFPYEVDDEVEQAYRQGWKEGFECCNSKMVSKVIQENAELRDMIKIQGDQIQRLRECISRNHEDFYD